MLLYAPEAVVPRLYKSEQEQNTKVFQTILQNQVFNSFIRKKGFEILQGFFSANCVKLRFRSKRTPSIRMLETGLNLNTFFSLIPLKK